MLGYQILCVDKTFKNFYEGHLLVKWQYGINEKYSI
jgi:hypothetical protein